MEQNKVLYRSTTNRIIGGVSAGLADYFNIDPIIMRIIFILITFLGGGGIIIYIILWIVVPEKETYSYNNKFSTMENEKTNYENPKDSFDKDEHWKNKTHGGLVSGIILITLGALFLVDRMVPSIYFRDLWPIILIVIGIVLLLKSNYKKDAN